MDLSTVPPDNNSLNNLFTTIISDLKNSNVVWEDFIAKCGKFHASIKVVLTSFAAFLESLQKVADLATNSQGASKDIGATLTRLCIRQRSLDSKLKTLNNNLMANLANPISDRLEEWKKVSLQLDKDHMKDTKRAKSEFKKASAESLRMKKKTSKIRTPSSLHTQLEMAMKDVDEKHRQVEFSEFHAVRKAVIEERSRFCFFVHAFQPVLDVQINMLNEIESLQDLVRTLGDLAKDPNSLPHDTEMQIRKLMTYGDQLDLQGHLTGASSSSNVSSGTGSLETGSMGSRKSSLTSLNSSGSASNAGQSSKTGFGATSQRHSDCLSSEDSGFTSQDTLYLKTLKSKEAVSSGSQHSTLERQHSSQSQSSTKKDGQNQPCTQSGPNQHRQDSGSEDEDESCSDGNVTPSSPKTASSEEKLDQDVPGSLRRNSLGVGFDKGGQYARPVITANTFEPPGGKPGSQKLYPNQSLPPPTYTNLSHLANAAQKNYSIPNSQSAQNSSGTSTFKIPAVPPTPLSKLPGNNFRKMSMPATLPSNLDPSKLHLDLYANQGLYEELPDSIQEKTMEEMDQELCHELDMMMEDPQRVTMRRTASVSQGSRIYARPRTQDSNSGNDPFSQQRSSTSTFCSGSASNSIYATPVTTDEQHYKMQKEIQQRGPMGEYVSPSFMAQLSAKLNERNSSGVSDLPEGAVMPPPAPDSPDLPLPPPPEELLHSPGFPQPSTQFYLPPAPVQFCPPPPPPNSASNPYATFQPVPAVSRPPPRDHSAPPPLSKGTFN